MSEEIEFYRSKHDAFVRRLDSQNIDEVEHWTTENLRMNGMYWGLTGLRLMGPLRESDREEVVDFVLKCFDPASGGFSGNIGHDPHIHYTLSAVQLLILVDRFDAIPVDDVTRFIKSLQLPDGSFSGDKWGEVDTRFCYCAISCLSLMGRLDEIDLKKAVEYIDSCKNFDGGYGTVPGAESHAGQIFCCVAALNIAGALDHVDAERLGFWLSERQVVHGSDGRPCGGLNGRPGKLPDVCYSWWVLSALAILGKLEWIDCDKLAHFILEAQDKEDGGFADRPGDMADVFHTFFGIAGLSLLKKLDLLPIDPTYALPVCILPNSKVKL